jgi:uncharacterized protein YyaL (SSP411 family)
MSITPELRARLDAALREKGPEYVPRTRHVTAAGAPRYTNRLILESSPYLLQHAHNPVSWFAWSDEPFQLARDTNRPVFLSVGYSTCHWCHVMEQESFEDEEIARLLNEHYVPIKVDREERPDVDSVYMTAVQALTGGGGWPMSVWLTPDRRPFFAGTYFPPRDGVRGARIGLHTLLQELLRQYHADPAGISRQASQVAAAVRQLLTPDGSTAAVGSEAIDSVVGTARLRFDSRWGGSRGAPKFPSSFPVRMLLRHHRRTGDARSLSMAIETLQHMSEGGIYDHVGGGFHRYSVDARWLVPHFEKMLYDNALLAVAYLEGFQASGEQRLARVARETLDYVAREMTAPDGGFYSATDADSLTPSGHRQEGYYFTWTAAELRQTVGAELARAVIAYYGVEPRGNFEGRNILHTPRQLSEVAGELGVSPERLEISLTEARQRLLEARSRRPPPLRDEKILASHNGLMLSAFAQGALVLNEPHYARVAARAAGFLLSGLLHQGRLRHSITSGQAGGSAFAEDYAFLAAGLLDLFEATQRPRWLAAAASLMEELERHHGDSVAGGYYLTPHDHEQLLAREKPGYDGAAPSANSVALLSLARLAELTDRASWRERAESTLRAFGTGISERPHAFSEMLLGVDFLVSPAKQIVIVLPSDHGRARRPDPAEPLLGVLRRTFLPNRVLLVGTEEQIAADLAELAPWASNRPARNGRATAYVCERGACQLPTTDPATFERQLLSA